MEFELRCPECGTLMNPQLLEDNGVVHCPTCPSRFVPDEKQALTYIDEIPITEYLGG
jgi:uncharacterized Zn finger protein (UPF0148 family)